MTEKALAPPSRLHYAIQYVDGKIERVSVGQREFAEWERQPFGTSSLTAAAVRPVLFFRFTAWAGLRRQRRLALDPATRQPLDYEAWDELVDEVETESGAVEDETAEDPTKQDQPAAG